MHALFWQPWVACRARTLGQTELEAAAGGASFTTSEGCKAGGAGLALHG